MVKKIFILLIFFYIFKNISPICDGSRGNKLKITKLRKEKTHNDEYFPLETSRKTE